MTNLDGTDTEYTLQTNDINDVLESNYVYNGTNVTMGSGGKAPANCVDGSLTTKSVYRHSDIENDPSSADTYGAFFGGNSKFTVHGSLTLVIGTLQVGTEKHPNYPSGPDLPDYMTFYLNKQNTGTKLYQNKSTDVADLVHYDIDLSGFTLPLEVTQFNCDNPWAVLSSSGNATYLYGIIVDGVLLTNGQPYGPVTLTFDDPNPDLKLFQAG